MDDQDNSNGYSRQRNVDDPRREATERRAPSVDVIGDLIARQQRLEAMVTDLQDQLNAAREAGDLGVDKAHLAHVMDRFFGNEHPVVHQDVKPKFDPMTGARLN